MASSANEGRSDGPLTDARLREALGERPFRLFAEIGSTNDEARDWAAAGARAGAVVVAEVQTQGRGRFGRAWEAPAGTALLMSAILRPTINAAQVGQITMLAAVAVAEALEPLLINPDLLRLKWPNDVQVAGKKVAGLLPEASWQGDRAEFVVVGIGLNVRVNFRGSALEPLATSLERYAPPIMKPLDRAVLLGRLLARLEAWTAEIDAGGIGAITLWQHWRERLNTLGAMVVAQSADGQQISGEAVDVDRDGALLIREADGTITRVLAGEVTLLK
jgi:BirA family biotin operon repressor/biotin-[acetyl-CoA-carboxylase] ligase